MFLKLDGFFLQPNTEAEIQLFNGTFTQSDNVITRDRMVDVSLVGNGERKAIDSSQWYEKDNITYLKLNTGEEGTKMLGVSTAPRNIELAAEDFNSYLEHDGVIDMLQWRKDNNAMDQDAVERYSKHVKTIFQVGETLTEDWNTVLGYPIEFIPLQNPYDIHPGHTLEIKLLFDGKPLKNQLVYVGNESDVDENDSTAHSHEDGTTHSHEKAEQHTHEDETTYIHKDAKQHTHDADTNTSDSEQTEEDHQHDDVKQFRTNENGIISIDINSTGVWYLRTIHLAQSNEEELTHESNWATLTFAIGEGHSHEHAEAEHHDHAEEDHHHHGIPSYVYWIGSLLLVVLLFFYFNRKK